ncbi:MAG: DUF4214 domain-containing protein [Acidimicrobiales bacterium]
MVTIAVVLLSLLVGAVPAAAWPTVADPGFTPAVMVADPDVSAPGDDAAGPGTVPAAPAPPTGSAVVDDDLQVDVVTVTLGPDARTDGLTDGSSDNPGVVVDLTDHLGRNLLVTTPVDRTVAIRLAGDTGWGPWIELDAGTDDGPDVAASGSGARTPGDPTDDIAEPGVDVTAEEAVVEGPTNQALALGPVRLDPTTDQIEVVAVGSSIDSVDLTFLADIETPTDSRPDANLSVEEAPAGTKAPADGSEAPAPTTEPAPAGSSATGPPATEPSTVGPSTASPPTTGPSTTPAPTGPSAGAPPPESSTTDVTDVPAGPEAITPDNPASTDPAASGPGSGDPVLDDPATDAEGEIASRAGDITARSRAANAVPAMPTIMPRSSWTSEGWAGGNSGCGSGPSYSSTVQAAVVHHTVTTNNYAPEQVDDLLRSVWYGHVRINGWCDVGYNFLVDKYGRIWEGRTGGVDRPVIGGHARGFNTSTVGIALLGQHQPGASPTAARPTEAQSQAVAALAAWKLGLSGVDPTGTTWLHNAASGGPLKLAGDEWHLVPTIMGHRDVGLTSCPGDYGLVLARGLRSTVAAQRQTVPPYTVPVWAPAPVGPGFVTVDARGGLRASGSSQLAGFGEAGTEPVVAGAQPVAVAASGTGAATQGYAVAADGTVTAFGGAPAVSGRPAGSAPVADLAVADGGGGWLITTSGAVVPFGGAPNLPVEAGEAVIAGAIDGAGRGYLLEADGGLRAVGSAPARSSSGPAEAQDLAVRPGGDSGWIVTRSRRLVPFGGAPTVGYTSTTGPSAEARAVVASGAGAGGWVLTADGQLWPFGNERLVLPLSTETAIGDAADVSVAGSVVPGWLSDSASGRYLNGLAELFVGRPATNDELSAWYWILGEDGRRAVTGELARYDPWSGRVIDQMYQDVLGRGADPDGRRYWAEQMRAGLSVSRLTGLFYGSQEYVSGSGSTDGYVTRLYGALLHRSPDPAGAAYWRRVLDQGTSPPDVAAAFVASLESRTDRVDALYRQVLGRGPDPGGAAYWADGLQRYDDITLVAELASSEEFYLRAVNR